MFLNGNKKKHQLTEAQTILTAHVKHIKTQAAMQRLRNRSTCARRFAIDNAES